MNKTDLINKLAERPEGDKKAAQAAVEGVIDLIQREVTRGQSVSISGFGVFEKRARRRRTARNPRTGEAVKVKKTTVPAFRPGKLFRELVAGTVKLPKAVGAPTSARATAAARPRRGRLRQDCSGCCGEAGGAVGRRGSRPLPRPLRLLRLRSPPPERPRVAAAKAAPAAAAKPAVRTPRVAALPRPRPPPPRPPPRRRLLPRPLPRRPPPPSPSRRGPLSRRPPPRKAALPREGPLLEPPPPRRRPRSAVRPPRRN